MANFLNSVDERTQLAGTNKLEILLFSLGKDPKTGREEAFGINVFKVREVMRVPEIVHAPDMPPGVEGMVSLRGHTLPVIDLARFCDIERDEKPQILVITEYNRTQQGFLVHSVDQILRMDWDQIKAPPGMLAHRHGGLVTAVTELQDNRLVMILDVEKVLDETTGRTSDPMIYEDIQKVSRPATVFYADDSSVARKQIERTLDTMGVRHMGATNGKEAWQKLQQIADEAEGAGESLADRVDVVLTDIEMPEMDGYVLTKQINADNRMKSVPVIMHSSLSSSTNEDRGKAVGATDYVPKFQPKELADTLAPYLAEERVAGAE
jgi:two-component system chemotaxis response regulator CheV